MSSPAPSLGGKAGSGGYKMPTVGVKKSPAKPSQDPAAHAAPAAAQQSPADKQIANAREIASKGLKALETGNLQEARDHFFAAENAFKYAGDKESSEEMARTRQRVDTRLDAAKRKDAAKFTRQASGGASPSSGGASPNTSITSPMAPTVTSSGSGAGGMAGVTPTITSPGSSGGGVGGIPTFSPQQQGTQDRESQSIAPVIVPVLNAKNGGNATPSSPHSPASVSQSIDLKFSSPPAKQPPPQISSPAPSPHTPTPHTPTTPGTRNIPMTPMMFPTPTGLPGEPKPVPPPAEKLVLPPGSCGIGMSFHPYDNGENRVTGIVPGSPADLCGMMQVGDIIVKVDGVSVHGKGAHDIIKMVVGPENTQVQITIQSQFGYPHVMTAPFQELPFDTRKNAKNKKSGGREGFKTAGSENALYGGGTLPKGFEHLEDLRVAQPYTTPSLSIRTVNLRRVMRDKKEGAVKRAQSIRTAVQSAIDRAVIDDDQVPETGYA